MPTLTTIIQYSLPDFSQSHEARERKKRDTSYRGERQIIPVCRGCDPLAEEPREYSSYGRQPGDFRFWKQIYQLTQSFQSWEFIQMKSTYERVICTPMFLAAEFTITKVWNPFRYLSTNDWMKKMWYIYSVEYYSAVRMTFFCFAAKSIQLETVMLSQISQSQKDKYILPDV